MAGCGQKVGVVSNEIQCSATTARISDDPSLDGSRTDESVPSICPVDITASNDQRDELGVLVANSPRVLKDYGGASSLTPKVEGGVIERPTGLTVKTTIIFGQPISRRAANEGVYGGLEPLRSCKEGETNDVGCTHDEHEPVTRHRSRKAQPGRLYREDNTMPAHFDIDIEKWFGVWKVNFGPRTSQPADDLGNAGVSR
jgi:hypothetical protein